VVYFLIKGSLFKLLCLASLHLIQVNHYLYGSVAVYLIHASFFKQSWGFELRALDSLKQVLYHLNHCARLPALFCFRYFDVGSQVFFSGILASVCNPPSYASLVTWIISVRWGLGNLFFFLAWAASLVTGITGLSHHTS
jgi:hypothetical protein